MSTDIQMYSEQAFSDEQKQMLQAPLSIDAIKHRSGGGGRMLKYIKGDTAIDAANRIFGFGQWGYKVIARSHEVIEDASKGRIEFYTADIELSVVGAAFPFPGDGVGIVTSPFTVEMHEKARKEAATDALKRALRHYGDQFGLSLYNEDDYVDAGDGTQIRVGDVKPGPKQQPPKRVVEAPAASKQIAQPATSAAPVDNKARFKDLYKRAVALHEIEVTESQEENLRLFLQFIGNTIGATVSSPGQRTASRLDAIEKYLESKDVA